jgi:hypothetical protein
MILGVINSALCDVVGAAVRLILSAFCYVYMKVSRKAISVVN